MRKERDTHGSSTKLFLTAVRVLCIAVFLSCPAFGQSYSESAYPTNASVFAGHLADIPGVVLWHWKVFRLLPANVSDLSKAISEEKGKLKPGESKKFTVFFSTMVDGQAIRFKFLHPTGQDMVPPPNIQAVAEIAITQEKYSVARIPVLAENDFKRENSLQKQFRNYTDYAFCLNAINALNGFTQQSAANTTMRDIDENARAAADGIVILVATKESANYQVYDLENKKIDTQSYAKRDTIKSMGNTVWMYVKNKDGSEYTIAYSRLEKIDVKLGQSLNQAQQIGSWKSTEASDCQWFIHRVFGTKQAFLRESGEQKPYCVYPATQ